MRLHRALSVLALLFTFLVSAKASAAFHLNKIVEVYAGGLASSPDASYVMIQSYSAFQNQLGGHKITVYSAAGVEIANAGASLAAVSNSDDQATVLIGTAAVTAAFGVTPDFVLGAKLNPAGGKVCFDAIPEDCFAWGNYTGSVTGVGTPFPPMDVGGSTVAKRKITGGTSATLLDTGDDTDNCANDFAGGPPTPKANPKSGVDGGSSSGGTDSGTSGGIDSGVGTKPSPPSTSSSSGSTTSSSGSAAAAPPAEDEGCNVASVSSSDISFGGLALTLGTAMMVLARSRRRKR